MVQLLTLFTGIMLAVMISVNGNLTSQYGVFWAAVIIHIVGSLVAMVACSLQKKEAKKPLWNHGPKWIYLGGVIGVFSTVSNNISCQYISITSIVALGLFGQMVTALCIDSFGLLGMPKAAKKQNSLWGFLFALIGIFVMMDPSEMTSLLGVFIAIAGGVSVVLSRIVNAHLAEQIGPLRGSLVNHLTGLPVTIVIAFLLAGRFPMSALAFSPDRFWVYLGGAMGVCVVCLCNITVPKISAFENAVITFIGQIFAGILIDVLIAGGSVMDKSFVGGLVVAFGIAINLAADRRSKKKEEEQQKYFTEIREVQEEHWRKIRSNT